MAVATVLAGLRELARLWNARRAQERAARREGLRYAYCASCQEFVTWRPSEAPLACPMCGFAGIAADSLSPPLGS